MNKTRMMLTTLGALIITVAFATAAQAITFRAHVSISGSDANTATNCPRANPCRNFSAAYSVTSAGGEIIALDSGGFGGLTITTAVTIMAIPGETAYTAVLANTSGVTVNAAAGDLVVLKNIMFSGSNVGTTTGITHLGGRLVVENCSFTELGVGVLFQGAKGDLIHCNFRSNTTGLRTNGTGCDPNANPNNCNTGTTQARVAYGNFNHNGTAFQQDNPGLGSCSPGFQCPNPVPFPPRTSIYVFAQGGQAMTNVTGNTVMSAGSGTGCADATSCINIPTYSFNSPVVN